MRIGRRLIRGYERDTFPDLTLRVVEAVYADVPPAAAPEEAASDETAAPRAPRSAQPMIEAESQT